MLHRIPASLSRARRDLAGLVSIAPKQRRTRRQPAVEPLEGRMLMSGMTAQTRMAQFGLNEIKGLCYTPEPSNDPTPPPGEYYDSDFWNNAFTPMWSSEKAIPGFEKKGEPVNGRGDLHTFKSIGVNTLHIYDWNAQRDHTSFLAQASKDHISVTVPLSNYVYDLPKTGFLDHNKNIYVYQLENIQDIFNQVYPGWQSGNFNPSPGVSMWLVTNEPDLMTGAIFGDRINPQGVTQMMQEIVYCENQANIPDADRLPIGVPLSFATFWTGLTNPSDGNPTPGVTNVEMLYNAFQSSTAFQASISAANPTEVTIPALPSDFFTTRFAWGINPIGNSPALFLGKESGAYAPYNHPVGASTQIDWNAIPLFFGELGGDSLTQNQPEVDKQQLAVVHWAETKGRATDPTFDGAMVFQSLDQVVHKAGSESHFGIQTVKKGDFKTITDVPPTPGLSNGSPVSNLEWRLDVLEDKPVFAVVKNAFTAGVTRKAR